MIDIEEVRNKIKDAFSKYTFHEDSHTYTYVDKNGEEKSHFKKVNILLFAKYVDQMERIHVRITKGNSDSDYNSWIITQME